MQVHGANSMQIPDNVLHCAVHYTGSHSTQCVVCPQRGPASGLFLLMTIFCLRLRLLKRWTWRFQFWLESGVVCSPHGPVVHVSLDSSLIQVSSKANQPHFQPL